MHYLNELKPPSGLSQRDVRVSFGHPIADFGHTNIYFFVYNAMGWKGSGHPIQPKCEFWTVNFEILVIRAEKLPFFLPQHSTRPHPFISMYRSRPDCWTSLLQVMTFLLSQEEDEWVLVAIVTHIVIDCNFYVFVIINFLYFSQIV